jgi:hypothetical protein
MTPEIENAMRNVDIFLDRETWYNKTTIKDSLMSTPKDELKSRTKHFMFLLKNLPTSVFGNVFYIDKEKDDIFQEAIKGAEYEEERETIKIRIEGFKS